jgi:hypothetical protein
MHARDPHVVHVSLVYARSTEDDFAESDQEFSDDEMLDGEPSSGDDESDDASFAAAQQISDDDNDRDFLSAPVCALERSFLSLALVVVVLTLCLLCFRLTLFDNRVLRACLLLPFFLGCVGRAGWQEEEEQGVSVREC